MEVATTATRIIQLKNRAITRKKQIAERFENILQKLLEDTKNTSR
ncbi:MAG: hypothetical protein UHO61_06310 [Acutalibacteraceae bacterium]|nr:hypothetical protein [Acutalibacteraceae bacterium]